MPLARSNLIWQLGSFMLSLVLGVTSRRKCTDPLFCVLFAFFVAGLIAIGVASFVLGDRNRLKYGYDSFGNTCGSLNRWNGTSGPDLRNSKHLYMLDPLSITSRTALRRAKSICLEQCPNATAVCSVADLPCTASKNYVCPYYRVNLYSGVHGTLPAAVSDWRTDYFSELAQSNSSTCAANFTGISSSFLQRLTGSSSPSSCAQYLQVSSALPGRGPCYPVLMSTREYANRCFPDAQQLVQNFQSQVNSSSLDKVVSVWEDAKGKVEQYLSDVDNGKLIIFTIGIGGAVVLSFIYTLLLRLLVGVMTWLTVVAVNLGFIACTLLSFQKSGMLSKAGTVGAQLATWLTEASWDPSSTDRHMWQVTAWVMVGISATVLIVTLLLITRIKVAIAALRIGSKALASMPTLLLFPAITMLLTAGFLIWWVFVVCFLYSAGNLVPVKVDPVNGNQTALASTAAIDWNSVYGFNLPMMPNGTAAGQLNSTAGLTVHSPGVAAQCAADPNCFFQVKWNTALQGFFIYHIFGLFWVTTFSKAFGIVCVSGAVASYYWSGGGKREAGMPRCPLMQSTGVALLYHMGSLALGSLIQSMFAFLHYLLAFIDARTKQLQQGNKVAGCLMKAVLCLLGVFRCILSFINRNAYIIMASRGSGYCSSAARASALIIGNLFRVATVDWMSSFVLLLAKLVVTTGCGVAAFLLFNLRYFRDPIAHPDTYVVSPLVPVMLTVVLAYIIADKFFGVWETAVSTIMLSFCEDCEVNGGNPACAPPALLAAIGKAHSKAGGKVSDITELPVTAIHASAGANPYPHAAAGALSLPTRPENQMYNYTSAAVPQHQQFMSK